MDIPAGTLVSGRCIGVNDRLGPEFKLEPRPENLRKPKSLDILKFKK